MNVRDLIHLCLIGHYSAYSADETIDLASSMNNGFAEAEALAKRDGREDIAEQMNAALKAVYEIVPFPGSDYAKTHNTREEFVHVDNVVARTKELGLKKII